MMEGTIRSDVESVPPIDPLVSRLRGTVVSMSSWLKFLGIIAILYGVLMALTIVGIVIAWLPIWLGILLFQAGDKAYSAQYSENLNAIVAMMDKLKSYFVIYAICIIVVLSFSLMSIFFLASIAPEVASKIPDFLDAY